jgi:hypothetical protein
MKGDPVPTEHHVARHCRAKDLILTNGVPTGVYGSAFEPKPDEYDGLSANWLEFFRGDRQHNIAGVRSVTKLTVKPSHRIAVLNVSEIIGAHISASLSVVEDPIDNLAPQTNAAHILIKDRGFAARKDQAVLDALAFLVRQGDIEKY